MQLYLNFQGFLLVSISWILCYESSADSVFAQATSKYSFIREGSEAMSTSYYDYIIVGGGTVGIPLATTLSQSSKVLVLERGGSPYGNKNITNLTGFINTLCDLSQTSASQRFISEDGVTNARARVLGGGTCLNAGFYSRASHDYVIKAGWDETLVNQSYEWVEKLLIKKPALLQWQSAVRDGLVEAGVTPDNGFTYDHLIGTKVGGTIFDRGGHRSNAADLLAQANPNTISVFLHATAHRLLFRHKGRQERLTAYGVMFKDSRGATHCAYLNEGPHNEIIVSAGAIGSPQLLMLSGIGPGDHLKSLGIDVILHQPLVGQGMVDNPLNLIYIPSPLPVETALVQLVGITNFDSYIESVVGEEYFICHQSKGSRKSSSSSNFQAGFIGGKVAHPISTGYLKLVDNNPETNPSVTFNYFKEAKDLRTCVKGLQTIRHVIESKALSKFCYHNTSFDSLLKMTKKYFGLGVDEKLSTLHDRNNSCISLEQYCKDTVMTIWHYHGGCQVNRVVDHDYKVLGIDRLRVIDGSVLTESPGTNPQATLMMLGRYMGVRMDKEKLMHVKDLNDLVPVELDPEEVYFQDSLASEN